MDKAMVFAIKLGESWTLRIWSEPGSGEVTFALYWMENDRPTEHTKEPIAEVKKMVALL